VQRAEQVVELGSRFEHAGGAVDADPPEPGPVLVPVIDDEACLGVSTHIVEATELRRRLRLPVDRADDLFPDQREAHRHDVRPIVCGSGRQVPDARLREPTAHHRELHAGARYRSRVADVGGLLLTGGASRRLGVDKATLVLRGERLADRTARLLSAVAAPVIEVGPGYTTLPAVREHPPGSGPLAALAAGADVGSARVLVLAVDLPFLDVAVLQWLASHEAPGAVVPIVDGAAQPLCARYSTEALALATKLVREGHASMRALLDRIDVHEAREDEWGIVTTASAFADVDTREDMATYGLERPG
jgi:molybdenum cofactor guanylyltransferase